MRALCLAGGGSTGAYEVGVLKHLLGDLELHYEIICGISVGALNGGFLAQYKVGEEKQSIKDLEELWFKIKDNSYVRKNWFPFGPLTTWKTSLYNTAPLQEFIRKNFDQRKVLQSGKKLYVGSVSFNDGTYSVYNQNSPVLVDAIYASAAFPIFFNPAKVGGHLRTDGGVRNQTPFKDAIDAGATEIDVIIPSPEGLSSHDDLFPGVWKMLKTVRLALRSLEIQMDELALGDLKACEAINKSLDYFPSKDHPKYRHIPVRLIRPEKGWGYFSLEFNPENYKKAIKIGYEDAQKMSWISE